MVAPQLSSDLLTVQFTFSCIILQTPWEVGHVILVSISPAKILNKQMTSWA
jgi:hypothetical protein